MPDDKPLTINPSPDPKLIVQLRRMELEAGWLGRVIGSPKNAPNNMALLTLVLTFGTGIGVGLAFPGDRLEFWKLLVPIITLTIGYVFGKNSNG